MTDLEFWDMFQQEMETMGATLLPVRGNVLDEAKYRVYLRGYERGRAAEVGERKAKK